MKIDTRWNKQIECCICGSKNCVESKYHAWKHFEECLDCGHYIMEVEKDLTGVGFNTLQELWYQKVEEGVL